MSHPKRPSQPVTIEELYPDLTPEQRQEAAYWLSRYLAVVRRIFERLEREREARLTVKRRTDKL